MVVSSPVVAGPVGDGGGQFNCVKFGAASSVHVTYTARRIQSVTTGQLPSQKGKREVGTGNGCPADFSGEGEAGRTILSVLLKIAHSEGLKMFKFGSSFCSDPDGRGRAAQDGGLLSYWVRMF